MRTLLRYPDGSGIEVVLPEAPYLLSWFSAGGAGSAEFMLPPTKRAAPRSLLEGDWNGVGPEIGASALDHDGDVDPDAPPARSLAPGEEMRLRVLVRLLTATQAGALESEIAAFNLGRSVGPRPPLSG